MDFENIEKLFQCPCCFDLCHSPIYQCKNGHIICNNCIEKLNDDPCPTCRIELPSDRIRALALEQLATTTNVKCRHWTRGCETSHSLEKIMIHLHKECIYEESQICKQFGSSCSSQVSLRNLKQHLEHSHGLQCLSLETDKLQCQLLQSAILGDLLGDDSESGVEKSQGGVWEPCFLIDSKSMRIYAIHSEYIGESGSLRWAVVEINLPDSSGQLQSESNGVTRVSITVELNDPEGQNEDDVLSKNKSSWTGEITKFSAFIERENSSYLAWNPRKVFSQPMGFFVDCSKKMTDIDRSNLFILNLSIFISQTTTPLKPNIPTPAVRNDTKELHSKVSLLKKLFNDPQKHLANLALENATKEDNSISGTPILESHSFHKTKQMHSGDELFNRECKICHTNPIKGILYSCGKCQSFDMCGSCTLKGFHKEHVLIRKKYVVNKLDRDAPISMEGVIHGRVQCDGCGINIRGIRFKCLFCLDTDLCESCEKKGVHDFHWLARTTEYDPAELTHVVANSSPENSYMMFHLIASSRGYKHPQILQHLN